MVLLNVFKMFYTIKLCMNTITNLGNCWQLNKINCSACFHQTCVIARWALTTTHCFFPQSRLIACSAIIIFPRPFASIRAPVTFVGVREKKFFFIARLNKVVIVCFEKRLTSARSRSVTLRTSGCKSRIKILGRPK